MTDPSDAEIPQDRRLWRMWREGKRPGLRQFLAEAGPLLAVDQRERWMSGARVPAEEYLRDFAAVGAVVDRVGQAVDQPAEVEHGGRLLSRSKGTPPITV
jgi:hypothetical protein